MLADYFFFYRMQILAGAGAVLAALVLAFVFWDNVFGKDPVPLQCILLDVSKSTEGSRDRYSTLARNIVAGQSQKDGSVCAIVVKGDPAGESDIQTWYVGADHPDNSSEANLERVEKQLKAAAAIDTLLRNPPQTVGGSALVEALNMVSRRVRPGDGVHVFSDGLQDSKTFVLRRLSPQGYSDAAMKDEIDTLRHDGLMPELAGVPVSFDIPSYRPGETPSVVPPEAAERFWKTWGAGSHTVVQWG
jgi:hypothetical protein